MIVVLALAVVQFIWTALYASECLLLVNTGIVSAMSALASMVGCLFLYAGAIAFARNAGRGKVCFIVAGASLAYSLVGWGLMYATSLPFEFGLLVAVLAIFLPVKAQVAISEQASAQ